MGNRLYVGNIPFDADEGLLKQYFGDGVEGRQVTKVKIVTDRESGRPRGFAFVEFQRPEDVLHCIQSLHGQQMGGRTIVVNEAREPRRTGGPAAETDPTGGGGEAGFGLSRVGLRGAAVGDVDGARLHGAGPTRGLDLEGGGLGGGRRRARRRRDRGR